MIGDCACSDSNKKSTNSSLLFNKPTSNKYLRFTLTQINFFELRKLLPNIACYINLLLRMRLPEIRRVMLLYDQEFRHIFA